MAAIALFYAPLAPIATVAATIVFWICYPINKYQLTFVYDSKIEQGGMLWNTAVNLVLAGTILLQLAMAFAIAWDAGPLLALSMVPAVLMVIGVKLYIEWCYHPHFRLYDPARAVDYGFRAQALNGDPVDSEPRERYYHPALYDELDVVVEEADSLDGPRVGPPPSQNDPAASLESRSAIPMVDLPAGYSTTRFQGPNDAETTILPEGYRVEEDNQHLLQEEIGGMVASPVQEPSSSAAWSGQPVGRSTNIAHPKRSTSSTLQYRRQTGRAEPESEATP